MDLKRPVLIISHSAEDEGDLYNQRIQEYAARLGVELISIEHLVAEGVNSGENNQKFSIGDVYQSADLVSYPSGYEGFGNAFIETIYYRKPIIVNRYSIYIADIEPLGFDVIPIEGFVTNETIKKVFEVLNDGKRLQEMADRNYQLGNRYFSYEVLERALLHLIEVLETQCGG
jgi:glycosyltransferase involved in cell wall biosynthesis